MRGKGGGGARGPTLTFNNHKRAPGVLAQGAGRCLAVASYLASAARPPRRALLGGWQRPSTAQPAIVSASRSTNLSSSSRRNGGPASCSALRPEMLHCPNSHHT